MNKDNRNPSEPPDTAKDPGFRNIFKLITLVVVLVAAWFLLDWLINGK